MPTTTIAPARARQYLRSQNLIGLLPELLILGQERAGPPVESGTRMNSFADVSVCHSNSRLLPKYLESNHPSIAARLVGEVQGKDPIRSLWSLQHLRIAQRANRIAVTSRPVFLHRTAGKLVIFGGTFIILGVVDELDKIVDFLIRKLRQPLGFRRLQQVLGKFLEYFRRCPASHLQFLEMIGRSPRAAGESNVLLPHFNLGQVARSFAAPAP